MRKEAIRAIAEDLGATNADELAQRIGEESMINDSSLSFCLACGAEGPPGTEPDVSNGPCEECGARLVSGADVIMANLLFADEDKINEWLEPKEGILHKKVREDRERQNP